MTLSGGDTALQEDQQASGSRRRARVRRFMVAAQVALSLGLVTGGASIVMSAMAMDDVHPGFNRSAGRSNGCVEGEVIPSGA